MWRVVQNSEKSHSREVSKIPTTLASRVWKVTEVPQLSRLPGLSQQCRALEEGADEHPSADAAFQEMSVFIGLMPDRSMGGNMLTMLSFSELANLQLRD